MSDECHKDRSQCVMVMAQRECVLLDNIIPECGHDLAEVFKVRKEWVHEVHCNSLVNVLQLDDVAFEKRIVH